MIDIAKHRVDLRVAVFPAEVSNGAMVKVVVEAVPVQMLLEVKIPGVPVGGVQDFL